MSYTVTYKKDEPGWWVATVNEVPGCHTQGKTIKQAQQRIREALSLYVDDVETADIEDNIVLPKDVQLSVDRFLQAKKDLEDASLRTQIELKNATQILKKLNLSVRDTGCILNMSHQRIQQLLKELTT